MELIVHFADHFSIGRGKRFARQARSLLAGQLTERIFLKPTGATGMIAARFKPAGAAKFFDFPMNEIIDTVIELDSCIGPSAHQLEEQILNAVSHRDRVNLLEQFLLERLKYSDPKDIFVDQACRYIVQSSGENNIANLASLVGLSERQIERKFLTEVGVSPKFLSRIARLQRFLSMAENNHVLTLTDAALACGYYDQAHFIRDFKAFSGLSPSSYLVQDNVLTEFFTDPL
ncbi:MAG: helix-turn-helix domain-containing protein [Proteobacteria bacterium]|nr:helix-turn-helix domain-containing protein [Pseudomonadota bacterium]